MIQMRPTGGGAPYAPNRDIVNAFTFIARRACYLLDENALVEEEIKNFLKVTGTTSQDLGDAAVALAQYINLCRQTNLDDPLKVLKESGFLKLNPGARTAILSRIGQVAMAMFYACSRDALRIDEKPQGMDDLLTSADEVRNALYRNKDS